MDTDTRKWPTVCRSAFTQGSCEEINEAFRNDPFLGSHKHGPACNGDVRAVVFPLSSQARACCSAEPKAKGEPPQVVSLRQCQESTYFSIASHLTANVTLLTFDDEADDDVGYQHGVEARIYFDPDGYHAELFNTSSVDAITAESYPRGHRFVLAPGEHCRLDANTSWSLDIIYRFGLTLRPAPPHVFNSLHVDEPFSLPQIHRAISLAQRDNSAAPPTVRLCTPFQQVSSQDDCKLFPPSQRANSTAPPSVRASTPVLGIREDDHELMPPTRRSSLAPPSPARCSTLVENEATLADNLEVEPPSERANSTVQSAARLCTPLEEEGEEVSRQDMPHSPSQSSSSHPSMVIFRDSKTIVKAFTKHGVKRVRKTIRTTTLHKAAMQWDRETSILKLISHPHVVKPIAWDVRKWTIDFEYAGTDLSKLSDSANVFNVDANITEINLVEIQTRILCQTALALKHVHDRKIMHSDIKPGNILLSDDHQTARLCDFGHAHVGGKWRGGGTEWYIPPEVLTTSTFDAAGDIWALGITMLFVLKIIPLPDIEPGRKRIDLSTITRQKAGLQARKQMRTWLDLVRNAKERISPEWSVVKDMLEELPRKRLTADALVDRLVNQQEAAQQVLVA